MDSNKFRNELKNIYIKYPEFVKAIKNYSDNYLKFLYMHLNENIKIELSYSVNNKNNIFETKNIKSNNKISESILIIYNQFLTNDEKKILKSSKEYNVNVFEESYEEKGSKDYFLQKNRRDFLIPCFFNDKTIEFLENMNKENTSGYHTNLKDFYTLLGNIRKNVGTKNRLGTIIASSISLQAYNIRSSKDLDTVILHPNYDSEKIKTNLTDMALKMDFMDPYIHNIYDDWNGIDKTDMYMIDQILDPNKINFYDLIVNPDYHYYFYGIKLIDLKYDLNYRAIRRFPKNVADLILVKLKTKIEIPKIKPLEELIIVETEYNGKDIINRYSKYEFIEKVKNYLRRFGLILDHDTIEDQIKEFTKE